MTDLEDAREQAIDERARRAAAGLHRAAATRPLPPMAATSSSASSSTSHRRLLAIAAAIVVIAGVAGLYATVGRRSDPLARTSDGDPIWIIGGLPSPAWRLTGVSDGESVRLIEPFPQVSIYATADVPLGPAVMLTLGGSTGGSPLESQASNVVESAVGGRTLALGDGFDGRRLGWVRVDDHWVQIEARPGTDDQLRMIAAGVDVVAGQPTIAALPGGLREVASGRMGEVAPVIQQLQPDPAVVTASYAKGRNGVEATASLSVGPVSPADLAAAALYYPDLTPVMVGDTTGWRSHHLGETVIWQRGGRLFVLTMRDETAIDPVTLAESVRRATEHEVQSVAGDGTSTAAASTAVPATSAAPPLTTLAPPVPAGTPGLTSDLPPVTIEVTRTVVSPNDIELRGAIPDGPEFRLPFTVITGSVRLMSDPNGGMNLWNVPLGSGPQVRQVSFQQGDVLFSAAIAITTDPAARYVEAVRTDGRRYRAELFASPAHPEIRVGGLVLPYQELASASLLDADGRVIDGAAH